MYLRNDGHTYYDGTEQHRSRGQFLILISRLDRPKELRALVRSVALRQLGHWMMGVARIYGKSIVVSGTYGADGLPVTIDQRFTTVNGLLKTDDDPPWVEKVWGNAVPLPQELYDAWGKGGGWNSAGSEAPEMRKWALKIFCGA